MSRPNLTACYDARISKRPLCRSLIDVPAVDAAGVDRVSHCGCEFGRRAAIHTCPENRTPDENSSLFVRRPRLIVVSDPSCSGRPHSPRIRLLTFQGPVRLWDYVYPPWSRELSSSFINFCIRDPGNTVIEGRSIYRDYTTSNSAIVSGTPYLRVA